MNPYVDVLSALLTPAIAIVTTAIAVFQYRIESHKWRLEMFDKRYPIYDKAMEFIGTVIREGNASDPTLLAFSRSVKDARLLFDSDVWEHLRGLYEKGNQLRHHNEAIAPLPVGEERSAHSEAIYKLLTDFGNQLEKTQDVFQAYLCIHKK